MRLLKKIIFLIAVLIHLPLIAQNNLSEKLINQGIWFLESTEIDERYENQHINQKEYFTKDNVSSIFFEENNIYTVYTKINEEVLEDRWKVIDETHYVMVGQDDQSAQIVEVLELNSKKLIIQCCNDIEGVTTCTKFTYLPTKENWKSDEDVTELNKSQVITE